MNYQGDIALEGTIDIKFTTVNTSGVPTTLAGSPAIAAYVANGTTEITAGITLTVDLDGRVGYHNVRVAATAANAYATASDVSLALTSGTVAGSSVVGYEVGSFSIGNRTVGSGGGGGTGDASQATLLAVKAKTDALPTDPADASDIAASFATVNGSLATIAGYVDTEVLAIKNKTDNLPTDPASASAISASFTVTNSKVDTAISYVDTEVAAIKAKTDNLPVDPADASDIASSFATLNTKVDVIDDFLDTEIAAIKAKTDQMVFTGGKIDANATMSLVAGDITAIADGILKRDWTSVSGEATYSLLQAARMLRNSWSSASGVLIVKKEDGTTTAWSRPLAVDPTAEPIVGAS